MERLQEIFCRGISIATSNGYLGAVKGFSRWLLEKERTDRDRLVSALAAERQHGPATRAWTLDEGELNRLVASAWDSGVMFEGLNGVDRAMIYLLAMTTGLRASELASMTPSRFDLATDRPTATVREAYTKNHNEAEQPLPADVAEAFRDYLRGRPAGEAGLAWEMERTRGRDAADRP